jgi:hypothetical protein
VPAQSRITFLIDPQLKERFFRVCMAKQQPVSEVVRALMQQWVRETAGGGRVVDLKLVRNHGLQQPARPSPARNRKVHTGPSPTGSDPSEF